jgi:hypothetical protein
MAVLRHFPYPESWRGTGGSVYLPHFGPSAVNSMLWLYPLRKIPAGGVTEGLRSQAGGNSD